jgi:AraC-like DNA-binding protein
MESSYLIEALLRGGAAGIMLVTAVLFARASRAFGVEWLGALFLFATAVYAVISSPGYSALLGPARYVFMALATLNTAFFWWFATALFDDDFRWRWWRWLPFVALAGLFTLRRTSPEWEGAASVDIAHQLLVLGLIAHVFWLALAHRKDDLVEKRRAFRLAFVVLAGFTGVVIAVVEMTLAGGEATRPLTLAHAIALFALSLGLTTWALPAIEFLGLTRQDGPALDLSVHPSAPEDRADLQRLGALMESGAFRQEALTIGALAHQLHLPEYRLRRLINGALGYRNFNTFLNTYRLREAREILSDPAQARRQITDIALDLGYGSVGPFNRAFKADTGTTPTQFRRAALADSSENLADS